ncbi:MAG: DUF3035 domain-containing protein [Pelagibacteraceae bacterium]
MKKIKTIFTLISLFYLLNGCGAFTEAGKALRNEKNVSSDEFLIKKRDPLTQPPEFDKIPIPDSEKNVKMNNKDEIKKILKLPEDKDNNRNSNSSAEESILKNIKK